MSLNGHYNIIKLTEDKMFTSPLSLCVKNSLFEAKKIISHEKLAHGESMSKKFLLN